jgi:hypothetical protein
MKLIPDPRSGTATLIYLPMVQIMVARVVKISTARERVRTVNRSDSQKILETERIEERGIGKVVSVISILHAVLWIRISFNADPELDPGI